MIASQRYLTLLMRCLTGIHYADPPTDGHAFQEQRRANGIDWPSRAETMAGLLRLRSLHDQVQAVLDDAVPGDLVECGVWRGGCGILMAAMLDINDVTDRTVWLADTFTGMPDSALAEDAVYQAWPDVLAVSMDEVARNFAHYGLLSDTVRFLPGLFAETLPTAPIDRIAVLRLDGDLYMSTMDALKALYPKVQPGGYVIIDDYGAVTACAKATHDYRSEHGITEPIQTIDWTGVYWRKG